MGQQITIDDVARAAGVSIKTVSRVINGEPHVTKRTRERVEQAIDALDYRPNRAARSLAAARTFVIGLFCARLQGFYISQLHRSALEACQEHGFHLIVEELAWEAPDMLDTLTRGLRHMRYEGVILCPPWSDDDSVIGLLEANRIPYVRISPATKVERSDAVLSDEAQGMRLLAEHFWQHNHRRIGLTCGVENTIAGLRAEYFTAAYVEAGGDTSDLCFANLDSDLSIIEAGRKLAEDFLAIKRRPTAIVSFNDEMAAAMIAYANESGLNVPRDLSVAGFDDADLAQLVWPQITTIHQPLDEMARAAVSLLLEAAGDRDSRQVYFPAKLIIRGSTGPAPQQ